MIKVKMLATVAALSLLSLPAAVIAKSPSETYVESYKGRTDVPVPVQVVTPSVDSRYAGSVVEIEFTVDKDGKPHDLASKSLVDFELEQEVKQAVEKWQFSPAMRNGQPVSMKVILPVRIVDSES